MLKVKPTGQRGRTTTGSGRNDLDLEKITSSISRMVQTGMVHSVNITLHSETIYSGQSKQLQGPQTSADVRGVCR